MNKNLDLYFMKQAFELAKKGVGSVHPNPLVGAVVVKEKKIIGRGFHAKYGGPHAEVNAILSSKSKVNGATLYVTLEPCSHFGKTPPCDEFIIQNNIKEVVIGANDPNPLVSGKGVSRLRKAGVRIRYGILKEECISLNRDYNHWIKHKMPYAIIKVAQSIDGKIATKSGESQWISGEASRRFSQKLRAGSDAILVGANTVLKDDPALSVRLGKRVRQPLKVILDSYLRISPNAKIFSAKSKGSVLIAVSKKASRLRIKKFQNKAEVVLLKEKKGRVDLRSLMMILGKKGIVRVLIEGGGEVVASAIEGRLVQEVYFFLSPKIIGGKEAVSSVAGPGIRFLRDAPKIKESKVIRIGDDYLIQGRI